MNVLFFILTLMLAVIVANILDSRIKFLPRAIVQILVGLLLSFVPNFNHFVLEPEIFMLAIIAPLMFHDGANTDINKLKLTLGNTFSLAVGLALTTILGVGYLSYLMLPHIPLALAFALAAIITPTDAVAVSSVTDNLEIPPDAMLNLKNESLFNDASGIVAFDLALTAFQTGHFSPLISIFDYLYVFLGGLIIGWIIGWAFLRLQFLLIESNIDDANIVVPINLIKPFAIYLAAELCGTSGILAAVAAGLVQSTQTPFLRLTSTKIQIVSKTTTENLNELLNGFVFILLGVSLPTVIYDIVNNSRQVASLTDLVLIGIVLYVTMIVIRYVWVSLRLASIRIRPQERLLNRFLIAINGIHGTITLAMAFSIPLVFKKAAFPFRNDLIFIAATVIVLSLCVPSIILPLVLPKKTVSYSADDISKYRQQMINYAIQQVKDANEDPIETQAVIATLQSQESMFQRPKRRTIFKLLQKCFSLEEQLLQEMVDQGEISSKLQTLYERMTFFQSYQLRQSLFYQILYRIKYPLIRLKHRLRHKAVHVNNQAIKRKIKIARDDIANVEAKIIPRILEELHNQITEENQAEVHWIESYYRERHRRLQNNKQANRIQDELFISAFQNEYNFIQNQLSKQNISRELANLLYEQVANDEWIYMQNDYIYA